MNIKLLAVPVAALLLAGCGGPSGAKPAAAAHVSKPAPVAKSATGDAVPSGPYASMTGVQMGQQLCGDWSSIKAAYLAAPWRTAGSVVMRSKLHRDAIAMDEAAQAGNADFYSDAIGAAITTVQSAPLNRGDRAAAARLMAEACASNH